MTGHLGIMLSAAVPLRAMELCNLPLAKILDPAKTAELLERMQNAGEAILYKVPGKAADGANAVADAVARLAFLPGGVRCFGMHFEYTPGQWANGKHGVPIDRDVPPATPRKIKIVPKGKR